MNCVDGRAAMLLLLSMPAQTVEKYHWRHYLDTSEKFAGVRRWCEKMKWQLQVLDEKYSQLPHHDIPGVNATILFLMPQLFFCSGHS